MVVVPIWLIFLAVFFLLLQSVLLMIYYLGQ